MKRLEIHLRLLPFVYLALVGSADAATLDLDSSLGLETSSVLMDWRMPVSVVADTDQVTMLPDNKTTNEEAPFVVPEPGTLALGLGLLGFFRRRKAF
jgi:hypothetical protein